MRLGSFYGIYDESGFIEIYMAEKASQSGANSVESYQNQLNRKDVTYKLYLRHLSLI